MASSLSLGGIAGRCTFTASQLLLACPHGAYTTARTFNRTRVLEFEQHVHRTATSAALLIPDAASSPLVAVDAARLRPLMEHGARLAVRALLPGGGGAVAASSDDPNAGELKLTFMTLWGDATISAALAALLPQLCTVDASAPLLIDTAASDVASPIAATTLHDALSAATTVSSLSSALSPALYERTLVITHATHLPPRGPRPTRVIVAGAARANAGAKDTSWVTARAPLEAFMRGRGGLAEEVLLTDAHGCVTEGTQTNFFALRRDGTLVTAGEGHVLMGTLRSIIIDVATREGVAVKEVAPSLSEGVGAGAVGGSGEWVGAFLSSTSRLLMPIDELAWRSDAEGVEGVDVTAFPPPGFSVRVFRRATEELHPTLARLEAAVSRALKERSAELHLGSSGSSSTE